MYFFTMKQVHSWFFFFQAEDGIRDYKVTGVQTCALPISGAPRGAPSASPAMATSSLLGIEDHGAVVGQAPVRVVGDLPRVAVGVGEQTREIGRASCRERA